MLISYSQVPFMICSWCHWNRSRHNRKFWKLCFHQIKLFFPVSLSFIFLHPQIMKKSCIRRARHWPPSLKQHPFLLLFLCVCACDVALINHLQMKRAAGMPRAKDTPRIWPSLHWDVPGLSTVFVMECCRVLFNRMERKTALMLSLCVRERERVKERESQC